MDAIAEIHVNDSAFVVHHLVAACAPPAVGVGGLVGNALIGFHFHDDAAGQLPLLEGKDMLAQKIAGNAQDIRLEEKGGFDSHTIQNSAAKIRKKKMRWPAVSNRQSGNGHSNKNSYLCNF